MTVFLVLLAYIVCAVLTYGITLAYFQYEFKLLAVEQYKNDVSFALIMSLFGPIGLTGAFLFSDFAKHGLKFK